MEIQVVTKEFLQKVNDKNVEFDLKDFVKHVRDEDLETIISDIANVYYKRGNYLVSDEVFDYLNILEKVLEIIEKEDVD